MKFVCDRCQTRYSIADEKVRQKILKIRCKTCENVITVREMALGPERRPAVASEASGAKASPPAAARARPPAPARPVEWYFAIDGAQQGPFELADLGRRIIALRKDEDVHIWREDFDGWKSLKDVAPVVQELRKQRAQTVPPRPPPRPVAPPAAPVPQTRAREASARGPVAQAAMAPFAEPEPTQLQPLDAGMLFAPGAVAPQVQGGAFPLTPGPAGSYAPVPRTDNGLVPLASEAPAFANGHGFVPGGALAPAPVLSAPPVAAVAPMTMTAPVLRPLPAGQSQIMRVAGLFSVNPALKFVAVGGAVVLLLIALVVIKVSGPDKAPTRVATPSTTTAKAVLKPEEIEAQARAEATQRFRAAVGVPPAPAPVVAPPPPDVAQPPRAVKMAKHEPPRRAVKGGPKAPVALAPPPVAPPPAAPAKVQPPPAVAAIPKQLDARRFAEPERKIVASAAHAPVGEAVSQSQMSAVVKKKENQQGLKVCYERALKRDERLRAGRLDVTVSIGISGMVKGVSVSAPPEFSPVSSCIKENVKRWRFPASNEEYSMAFPLIFQGSL